MRQLIIGMLALSVVPAAAFSGCGDQPETPTGATSGPVSGAGGTVSGSSAGTGGAGTGGAGTGGTGTGGSTATLNGCDPATAMDFTGQATATIAFGGSLGLAYSPACIKVKAGTMVTFNGDFSTHPLQGGVATSATDTPAAPGTTPLPTTTPMSMGTTATFTMQPAGAYGYYCAVHVSFGMQGAIFVQ
jgi:plastocyanin